MSTSQQNVCVGIVVSKKKALSYHMWPTLPNMNDSVPHAINIGTEISLSHICKVPGSYLQSFEYSCL